MTDTSTTAVTALLQGVTPGPWVGEEDAGVSLVFETGCGCCTGRKLTAQDAAFIAAARDLVPALLAERDAAYRACADLREDKRAAMQDAYRAGAEAMRAAAVKAVRDVLDGELVLAKSSACGTSENLLHAFAATAAAVAAAIRAIPLPAAPGSGDGPAAGGDGEVL